MAYLALYTSIRVGDFELREAAIQMVGPLFLAYNKNLYHALCIHHLVDMARLSENELAFATAITSLSLKGNVGKNSGLDEIQEITFNLYMKVMATRLNIDYLSSLSPTLQCKSRSVATFETEFDCGLSRKRKLLRNARRTRAVGFMYSELRRDGSPFRLDNKEGEEKYSPGMVVWPNQTSKRRCSAPALLQRKYSEMESATLYLMSAGSLGTDKEWRNG
ncbi:unnamed protein product [Pylaiella littoralis]